MNVELEILVERAGLYDVTEQVIEIVSGSGIDEGLVTVFIQHTSASLVIQENADPSVLADLQAWMDRSVPQDSQLYAHRAENIKGNFVNHAVCRFEVGFGQLRLFGIHN